MVGGSNVKRMTELVGQLGLDWRLLLSQAANFLILLIVLRVFAYRPILNMLKERRARIEEGLTKAEESDRRLAQANEAAAARRKEADAEALAILRETEVRSKELEDKLLANARRKEAEVLKNTDLIIKGKAEQARREVEAEAAELVKNAIVATVELDPKTVDEALVAKAVRSIRK